MTTTGRHIPWLTGLILLTLAGIARAQPGDDSEATRREAAAAYSDRTFRVLDCISSQHIKHPSPSDLTAWAVRGLFQSVNERIPTAMEQRLSKIATLNADQLESLLADARLTLGPRNEFANHHDVDLTVLAVLRRLEPFTNPEGKFQQDTGIHLRQVRMPFGRYPGPYDDLGLVLRQDGPDGVVRVVTPVRDGPAYKAGLRAGDLIPMFVEEGDQFRGQQTRGRIVYTRNHTLDDILEMLRGRTDSAVRLYVQRHGTSGFRSIEVERGASHPETVFGVERDAADRWHYVLDAVHRIGYVRIKSFDNDANSGVVKALTELRDKGVRGLVLDLRFTTEGRLGEMIRCIEPLVGRRPITISLDDGQTAEFNGDCEQPIADLMVACLVNSQTRRVAELAAACLQDHRRAAIVGERTAGEVEIMGYASIAGVGDLRLTTGVYRRVSGGNLSRMMAAGMSKVDWGVQPDVGLVCDLSQIETAELADHLYQGEVIHSRWWQPGLRDFRDRQLDLALLTLREQLRRR